VYSRSRLWYKEGFLRGWRALKGLGQDVDDRVMEGVSHFLMMDKPEEFNAAVTDFLLERKRLAP
jgi:pimeloyl-ACP methyl ester carboxylesterase